MTSPTFTPAPVSVPTRASLARALESEGVTGPAADHLLSAGRATRHAARVVAAREAALAFARWCCARAEEVSPSIDYDGGKCAPVEQLAGLLCLADAGPRWTTRAHWASALGKGRRQASDGPAWSAAIVEAAGGFRLRVQNGALVLARDLSAGREEGAIIEALVAPFDAVGATDVLGEVRLLLGAGLSEAHRLVGCYPEPQWATMRAGHEAARAAWAAVYNQVAEALARHAAVRAEVEAITSAAIEVRAECAGGHDPVERLRLLSTECDERDRAEILAWLRNGRRLPWLSSTLRDLAWVGTLLRSWAYPAGANLSAAMVAAVAVDDAALIAVRDYFEDLLQRHLTWAEVDALDEASTKSLAALAFYFRDGDEDACPVLDSDVAQGVIYELWGEETARSGGVVEPAPEAGPCVLCGGARPCACRQRGGRSGHANCPPGCGPPLPETSCTARVVPAAGGFRPVAESALLPAQVEVLTPEQMAADRVASLRYLTAVETGNCAPLHVAGDVGPHEGTMAASCPVVRLAERIALGGDLS